MARGLLASFRTGRGARETARYACFMDGAPFGAGGTLVPHPGKVAVTVVAGGGLFLGPSGRLHHFRVVDAGAGILGGGREVIPRLKNGP